MEIAVVTGTSSGIGLATSLHLARRGFRVFAGMRNLAKADPLRAAAAGGSLPVEVISSVRGAFEDTPWVTMIASMPRGLATACLRSLKVLG